MTVELYHNEDLHSGFIIDFDKKKVDILEGPNEEVKLINNVFKYPDGFKFNFETISVFLKNRNICEDTPVGVYRNVDNGNRIVVICQEVSMIRKIYFAMDGVLADFNLGVSELCGLKRSGQGEQRSKEDDDRMWEGIRSVDHFYDLLKPMPGALEMFRRVYEKYGSNCEILTGIPKPKRGILTAGEDKTTWAHRLLTPELKVNIVYREEKKNFCTGKDTVLIDDMASNIEQWESFGGVGILHINAENTLKQLQEKGIL